MNINNKMTKVHLLKKFNKMNNIKIKRKNKNKILKKIKIKIKNKKKIQIQILNKIKKKIIYYKNTILNINK